MVSDVNLDHQDWRVASGEFCDHGKRDGEQCGQCEARFVEEEELEYALYFDEVEEKYQAQRDADLAWRYAEEF